VFLLGHFFVFSYNYRLTSVFLAMTILVAASNFLVQFPINVWLTWGSFTYPASYLVTEITSCLYGSKTARKVVYVGFAVAVLLSIWLATLKIALASGTAFLVSQLLYIIVFNRLQQATWWYAHFLVCFLTSLIDTVVFWNIAFWGEQVPLLTWTLGDFSSKLFVDSMMLIPFRTASKRMSIKSYAPATLGTRFFRKEDSVIP
jgi:queuosine precursor transporter